MLSQQVDELETGKGKTETVNNIACSDGPQPAPPPQQQTPLTFGIFQVFLHQMSSTYGSNYSGSYEGVTALSLFGVGLRSQNLPI